MGYDIKVSVSESVGQRLEVEASMRKITVEELASERLSELDPSASQPRPAYSQLLRRAQEAVTHPRTKEEIDADIEQARNEWKFPICSESEFISTRTH